MKKLILLTSALTLIGGAAVAEITVSGEASVSYGNWETAAGTAAVFDLDSELTFGLEETTSGGLTYGAEITIDGDAGTVGNGVFWVSGGFGKVSFGIDEFDELNADEVAVNLDINGVQKDHDYGDVKYEGDFGSVSVTLVADARLGDTPSVPTTVAATDPDWDLGLAYAGGGYTLGLDTDSNNDWKVSASVDVGNFTIAASFEHDNDWDLSAKAAFGGINVKLSADESAEYGIALDGTSGDVAWAVATNTSSETSASIDYTMGDLSVGLAYDNDDAGFAGVADRGDEADLILTLGYSMDALDFELKFNDVNEYELSVTAGFTF
ncbi:MAG: porin [Paracoccaceae bacterium]